MNRKIHFQTVIETVCRYYPDTIAIYIFSSVAKKSQSSNSDVHIAVLLSQDSEARETSFSFSDCKFTLENALKQTVNLMNLREVSTVFQSEIINAGEKIFGVETNAVLEFEMLVLSTNRNPGEEHKEIIDGFIKPKRAYDV